MKRLYIRLDWHGAFYAENVVSFGVTCRDNTLMFQTSTGLTVTVKHVSYVDDCNS